MDGYTFDIPPTVPKNRKFAVPTRNTLDPSRRAAILSSLGPRKLVHPSRKDITPALRSSIISDLQPRQHIGPFQTPTSQSEWVTLMANDNKQQAEQMQANAELNGAFDDAARAMADALQSDLEPGLSREEQCRRDALKELKTAIDEMLSLVRVKNEQDLKAHCANAHNAGSGFIDDHIVHIDAGRLARAWEKQVWVRTYETDSNVDKYVDQMDTEVIDLGLWVQHFDSELCGYDMFRSHLYRCFGSDKNLLGLVEKQQGMFGATKTGFAARAEAQCFVPRGARGVEDIVFNFHGLSVVSVSSIGVGDDSLDVDMDG